MLCFYAALIKQIYVQIYVADTERPSSEISSFLTFFKGNPSISRGPTLLQVE